MLIGNSCADGWLDPALQNAGLSSPRTRDVIQTVYIRKVEKAGGAIVNVDFDKVANVKDPTHK